MFSALLNRAQATVDNAIGNVVNRAIIAIPFVLAGAFATAALAFRLVREYGPETANLMLAGLFVVLGIFTAIVFRARPASQSAVNEVEPDSLNSASESQAEGSQMSAPDHELLLAALASAAPIALPTVFRLLMRNLPIVLAVIAAIFVMTRATPPPSEAEPATS